MSASQRVMVTEIIGIIVTQLDSLIFIIADMGHKALLVFPIVQPVDPAGRGYRCAFP